MAEAAKPYIGEQLKVLYHLKIGNNWQTFFTVDENDKAPAWVQVHRSHIDKGEVTYDEKAKILTMSPKHMRQFGGFGEEIVMGLQKCSLYAPRD